MALGAMGQSPGGRDAGEGELQANLDLQAQSARRDEEGMNGESSRRGTRIWSWDGRRPPDQGDRWAASRGGSGTTYLSASLSWSTFIRPVSVEEVMGNDTSSSLYWFAG
jgi:hypothetical protein